ncbi:MAG: hypothetical protein QUV05_20750, partial [Phycisphaerae bacterium]|nr:hypothetical protein [Phycisphaerae bacterium]
QRPGSFPQQGYQQQGYPQQGYPQQGYQQNPDQPGFQQQRPAGVEFRQCFKCNYEAVTGEGPCPRCRCPKFLTAGSIRTRGGILVALGLFLAGLMGVIALVVGALIWGQAAKDPATARRLTEEADVWLVVGLIFAAVIAFGLHCVISGVWMLAFGKRNRMTVWVMWLLLGMIFVFGAVFRFLT